jgi:hypothetical protein
VRTGDVDIPSTRSDANESKIASKHWSGEQRMKFMAITVVAVMVAAGFVMLAPVLKSNHDKSQTAPEENQADIATGGTHYLNTTISNMFESYLKVTTPTGGFQTGVSGINDWWAARQTYYGDVMVRNQYPYVVGYSPYSAEVPLRGVAIPMMKYGLYSFYRATIDSPSLTTIGTGPNSPLGFVPILGTPWTTYSAMSGGWVNWSYYLTYATTADIAAAQAGTGYMTTYYGVAPDQFDFYGPYANDGWYVDFQGRADFNRAAAKKFLGLTGSADLRTQFNLNNTGTNLGKMNASWSAFWTMDGSNAGHNDTYTAYDYSLDFSPLRMFLSVDPSSTANKLVLRVYGIVWGVEFLMLRYMDRAGIYSKGMASPEDWYLNGTASPYGTDIKSRMVCVNNMLAWKDTGFYSPAWYLDFMHIDYAPNTAGHEGTDGKWLSRYNPYMATSAYRPTYMTWSPGTLTYGAGCAYPFPPMTQNLLANEKIVIQLPDASRSVAGYLPYRGTGTQDTLSDAKLTELNSHLVWGELGLGSTFPTSLRSATYYDHMTKTLTLNGPMTLARNPNAVFPVLNATGSPSFSFDVMRVSNYEMSIVEPAPYSTGQTYHLQLTAKNVTGATVTDWNGTVALSQYGGVVLGDQSHTFVPTDAGVWTTTVQFSDPSLWRVDATDSWFPLDVTGTIQQGGLNRPPVAYITQVSPNPAREGSRVSFYGQGVDLDGYIMAYKWFEGSWVLSTLQNFYTYSLPAGTHTISFMVEDNGGAWSDPVSVTVTILPNTSPVALFTFSPASAGIEVPFWFDASASYDLEDWYGLRYRWDFNGDGIWDEGWTYSATASHTYGTAGDYLVMMQAMDSMGAIGTCTHVLTVLPEQAFPSVWIQKTPGGNSSESWQVTAMHGGVLTISLANEGFKSVVVEVHDVTTKDVKVFQKNIVFNKYKAYPIGIASFSLKVIAGHTYTIILKQFDGPVYSGLTVTPKITW